MKITPQTLSEIGYSEEKAQLLINQLQVNLSSTSKTYYKNVERAGKTIEQRCTMREFDYNDVIRFCEKRIKDAGQNAQIKVKRWELLKERLERWKQIQDAEVML